MNYKNTKIYHDGSHYIGIPQGAYPSRKHRKRYAVQNEQQSQKKDFIQTKTPKELFESAYSESLDKPKRERKEHIKSVMQDAIENTENLDIFVEENIERKKTNAIKRRVRLMRKLHLQQWDYFVTFTYSDMLHTEETFRKKLSNTLKHFVARNGWKYVGVWERSPENNRLHFHGIFHIPKMVGNMETVRDYDTKNHRMQTTYQNSHFLKHFGRNDFKPIVTQRHITEAVSYITKYMKKSGERLVYGGKLPTYFISDILEDDVMCPYGIDDRKILLADKFICINEGKIIGEVSNETISQLPKCN